MRGEDSGKKSAADDEHGSHACLFGGVCGVHIMSDYSFGGRLGYMYHGCYIIFFFSWVLRNSLWYSVVCTEISNQVWEDGLRECSLNFLFASNWNDIYNILLF